MNKKIPTQKQQNSQSKKMDLIHVSMDSEAIYVDNNVLRGQEGRQAIMEILCYMFNQVCNDYDLCQKNMILNLIDYVCENNDCSKCNLEFAKLWEEKDKKSLS